MEPQIRESAMTEANRAKFKDTSHHIPDPEEAKELEKVTAPPEMSKNAIEERKENEKDELKADAENQNLKAADRDKLSEEEKFDKDETVESKEIEKTKIKKSKNTH